MSLLNDLLLNKSSGVLKKNGDMKTSGELISEVTNDANLVDGKQTWEYAESHKDDLNHMIRCCDAELEVMRVADIAPSPYYFERVAILSRKIGDYAQEVAYCEKYISSVKNIYKRIGTKNVADVRKGPRYKSIVKRLPKAKELLAKKLSKQ